MISPYRRELRIATCRAIVTAFCTPAPPCYAQLEMLVPALVPILLRELVFGVFFQFAMDASPPVPPVMPKPSSPRADSTPR